MSVTIAVVNFPGSNCEHDVRQAIRALGGEARIVWHGDTKLGDVGGVVIPGGFAHGDYLRPGAIARFSPIMDDVVAFAEAGGPVLGICNGFQVLTEAGLLAGALMRNEGLRFLCETTRCEVVSNDSVLTTRVAPGTELSLPINHYHGNFCCDADELALLEANGLVVLRYCANPNGSINSIAGIKNERGNVVGIMPHPERATNALTGSVDGLELLRSFLDAAGLARLPATKSA